MKNIILIAILFFSYSSYASIRVMSFNTTCSLCSKGKFDKFKKRKHWIVDTIKRTNPDLISMQEVLLPFQLRWFKKKLKNYNLYYYRKYFIFRYADPALFIKKDRFKRLTHGGFWLGPRGGRFSLGWKKKLPRKVEYLKLRDKVTHKEFYFVGSHFDNSSNKEKSVDMLIKRFKDKNLPIIFAADTNLKPSTEGFKTLNDVFFDSFNLTKNVEFLKNSDTTVHDSCNLEKGKTFPECRVDHIMLSKKHSWIVSKWVIDQFKYGSKNRFTSDHRAMYADIDFN